MKLQTQKGGGGFKNMDEQIDFDGEFQNRDVLSDKEKKIKVLEEFLKF